MNRSLAVIVLGSLVILAILGAVSDPAWNWAAIGAALRDWTATVLTVFTVTLFVSLCALGWAHVYLVLRREWRAGRLSPRWAREQRRREEAEAIRG